MRPVSFVLCIAFTLLLVACSAATPADTPSPEPASPTPEIIEPTPGPVTPAPAPLTPAPATPTLEPGTPQPAEPTPAQAQSSVSIFDFGFDPALVEVTPGTAVMWTNDGQLPHTVTFAEGPNSGALEPDATFQHTFEEAGSFEYVCTFHPGMSGTITVAD